MTIGVGSLESNLPFKAKSESEQLLQFALLGILLIYFYEFALASHIFGAI